MLYEIVIQLSESRVANIARGEAECINIISHETH